MGNGGERLSVERDSEKSSKICIPVHKAVVVEIWVQEIVTFPWNLMRSTSHPGMNGIIMSSHS